MTALPHRPPPERKPWHMKWIVVTIVVFVAGYTLVNVYFRKPGRAFRPAEDMNNRATTARLLAAGWQKLAVEVRRPAEKPEIEDAPAAVTRDAPGLGADLESKFVAKPRLLASIDRVFSPSVVAHGGDYPVYFIASLGSLKEQVGELALYHKGHELVLIPSTEPLPGRELKSRWNDSTYWVGFPTAKLPPGRYEMRIVAKGPAAAWSFTVK